MTTILGYIFLALGFGFVIFWHELGHFLAAKWAGVKVEQFAVGFGTAAVAWRKGLGWRLRGTRTEYEKRCREYLRTHDAGNQTTDELADAATEDQRIDAAGRALGLGETEYRLNWLPLGGYVKMLGQDDMNPNAVSSDPRAYNTQTIGKRMVIVSMGVIMNVILAAMLFCWLFLIGFNVPPAIVGYVYAGSPAQQAGLQVGDHVVTLDGDPQLDFTKIYLSVALLDEKRSAAIEVERPDDNGVMQKHSLTIQATRAEGDERGILVLGILPSLELRGLDPKKVRDFKFDAETDSATLMQIAPGDEIVSIEGKAVADPHGDYWRLDRALQRSDGRPVNVTVRNAKGETRDEKIEPRLMPPFSDRDLEFFGMTPRAMVGSLSPDTLAKGKLAPGDVIVGVTVVGPNDPVEHPSTRVLRETLNKAGQENNKIKLTVLRRGEPKEIDAFEPSLPVDGKKKGIGVGLAYEQNNPVAAIKKDSPADKAGVPRGATIVSINDQPVVNWHDVRRILRTLKGQNTIALTARLPDSTDTKTFNIKTTPEEFATIDSYVYSHGLLLRDRIDPRQTNNPVQAAAWGVRETRDLILQFYLTLKRMVQGSIPLNNAMGPVGIVQAGARLSERGNDWLIWFLAQISANLAVVNFLPIPIVDGGLFLFLIIEKLQGRPLSNRTQSIAQVIGLALIASVFIFVTYQDIMR